MQEYAKALVALLFAAATGLASALSDNAVTIPEWVQIGIAAVTAFNVLMTSNVPGSTYAKTAVAAVLAGLNFLVGAVTDGMTTAEWINFALAVGAVVFVWAVPNRAPVALDRLRD